MSNPAILSRTIFNRQALQAVANTYGKIAKTGVSEKHSRSVAQAFGYTPEQLNSIPRDSNMGLSCGNPVGTANVREGETVVDLGSGGGIDVFLAAEKVGLSGFAIGLDVSDDMIALARKNARSKGLYPPNVAFVKASLTETLPLTSNSVDCVLSNCVINLLPFEGKTHALKEVHRILKPGGRVVLDDIVAKKQLSDEIRNDLTAYANCISGAVLVDEYKGILQEAGFNPEDTQFVDTENDLSIYYTVGNNISDATNNLCCAPKPTESTEKSSSAPTEDDKLEKPFEPLKFRNFDINEWVASYQIYAIKSSTPSSEAIKAGSSPLSNWWDAFPIVQATDLGQITADELAPLVRDKVPLENGDWAVIDVRRNDHAGGHVRGSHQWPAQTFYNHLAEFYERFGKTKNVAFYCNSSNGRGPRCAGWYQDYLDELKRNGEGVQSRAVVLAGGIKNWLAKFDDDALVDKD